MVPTSKHGRIEFQDAAGSVTSVVFGPSEGNFSVSELSASQVEAIPVMDRGTFYELVEGDQTFAQLSWTVIYDLGNKVFDALLKSGSFANASTADPGGIVWTGAVRFVTTRANVVEVWAYSNVRLTGAYSEAKTGNTVQLSGVCYGGYTRTAS